MICCLFALRVLDLVALGICDFCYGFGFLWFKIIYCVARFAYCVGLRCWIYVLIVLLFVVRFYSYLLLCVFPCFDGLVDFFGVR